MIVIKIKEKKEKKDPFFNSHDIIIRENGSQKKWFWITVIKYSVGWNF